MPNGMPMMVTHSTTPCTMWISARYQPPSTNQIRLSRKPSGPVPRSSRPVMASRGTTCLPKGKKVKIPIRAAAKAHGRPTMVIPSNRADSSHARPATKPPSTNHRIFNSRVMTASSGSVRRPGGATVTCRGSPTDRKGRLGIRLVDRHRGHQADCGADCAHGEYGADGDEPLSKDEVHAALLGQIDCRN